MQRDSDEDAWQAIVENYGERVQIDDGPVIDPEPVPPPTSGVEPIDDDLADDSAGDTAGDSTDPHPELAEAGEERFVPPPPPPLPRLPPDRLLAWSGLFGSPSVLLVCLVIGVSMPPWLGYLLVASFIGGFLYLVMQMPRDPADPWDDGARL